MSLFSCFGDSAALAATPAETLASETILGLRGEVTVMSKAAVSLIPQLDTRISEGVNHCLNHILPQAEQVMRHIDIF